MQTKARFTQNGFPVLSYKQCIEDLPAVGVALGRAITMPEVLVGGLVAAGQVDVKAAQPTHKTAQSKAASTKVEIVQRV